jgi:hypothetical protein
MANWDRRANVWVRSIGLETMTRRSHWPEVRAGRSAGETRKGMDRDRGCSRFSTNERQYQPRPARSSSPPCPWASVGRLDARRTGDGCPETNKRRDGRPGNLPWLRWVWAGCGNTWGSWVSSCESVRGMPGGAPLGSLKEAAGTQGMNGSSRRIRRYPRHRSSPSTSPGRI